MSVNEALRDAAARLAAISDTPRLDAELLMAHALGVDRNTMLLHAGAGDAPETFAALVARRLTHEPVAYITGTKGFWTLELAVSPAVLIPRPDSETLIEAAIEHFGDRAPRRILDLGTGSGALLLAALDHWPEAAGVGVDASAPAIEVGQANAARLGFATRAEFMVGYWHGDASADLILCNPPYIKAGDDLPRSVRDYEPHSALFAGADGLDDYARIAAVLDFAPGGCACIEIGASQGETAGALFRAAGFAVSVRKDLAGLERCLLLVR